MSPARSPRARRAGGSRVVRCLLAAALLPIGAAGACGDPGATPPPAQLPFDGATYWPAAEWRRAEPAQVGMDGARLERLARRLASNEIRDLSGLVIVRQGYVVLERYFNGSGPGDVHTMQSVTKSVASLVAGIAVGDGRLDPAARIFDVLPEYADLAAGDARKAAVRVEHLLAMRSGIDFHESPYEGSPLERLNESSGDWARIALEPPMNAAPGERWQYNSGGVIVVAKAVARATGTPFDWYARERLFAPIGVAGERWARSPFDGLPHTGGGLSLRAMDLARVGYLVLRGGRWGDRQVVPASWLRDALRPITPNPRPLGGRRVDYGLLWWLFPIDPARSTADEANVVWAASGNLNQWLFVAPSLDLVVAVTGRGNAAFGAPVEFMFEEIVPAVRR